jgi:sigma-E factor negative regulatory protein RseC
MVIETGTVIRIDGTMARVRVPRKTACEGCSSEGACESTPEGMEIEAFNPVKAREGQRVKVLMAREEYLKGAVLVYGLPLVFFIAGAIVGKELGEKHVPALSSDLVAAITGFALLILSFAGVGLWSRKKKSKSDEKPVIEEIIE